MSIKRNASVVGPLFVTGYCIINSTKSVLEGALVQDLSPEFIALNSFVLAQLFYFLTLRDKKALFRDVRRCLPDVIMLNIMTAICWIAVLYAFTVFEPAMANAIIIGLGPTVTILLGFKLRPGVRAYRLEIAAAAGMLAVMAYLLVEALDGSSAIGSVSTGSIVFGVCMCVATSVSLAGITYYTKRLSDQGMVVRQMMASRFPVLIVSTFALMLFRSSFGTYTFANTGAILAISIVGVIISLYLLQQGIVRTEPITVSMLYGMNLVITYLTQFLDPRLHQSLSTFVGIALITMAMVLGTLTRWRADRKREAAAAPVAQPETEGIEA
ncbi:DMT family transporter [Streptomyces sp. SID10853]|uniref:DMT family transporter n=1 Tax=Streptomyces sp. SID10853 TaxID=2706028 RepID=UPI0013BECD83|nr:DMT family transporter [Streptomyces sp. SID10853]NDZ78905.1 DMT family transporter [Streptomyces sp. SID10853]